MYAVLAGPNVTLHPDVVLTFAIPPMAYDAALNSSVLATRKNLQLLIDDACSGLRGCRGEASARPTRKDRRGDNHHITLEGLPRVGQVGERFQSYNVEMAEVIGGRFGKPYGAGDDPGAPDSRAGTTLAGMDPLLYRYRPLVDLSDARLRKLAAALGPAYVRVSGR
jgi:hypothetical protein